MAAFVVFLLGNGFAHRAVADHWGVPGLVVLYAAWLVVALAAWLPVRYEKFPS